MNPIAKMQKWMDSPSGQVFMNYAYSWGAAIVILGTLFKLTHIAGANAMLFIGMGTEVFVFFISGFEKTYVKTPRDINSNSSGMDEIYVDPISTHGAASVPGTVAVGDETAANVGTTSVSEALSAGAGLSAAAANLAAAGQAAAQAQLALDQLQSGGASVSVSQIKATDPASIEEAVKSYVEELSEFTEVLSRVKTQAERMSTDSEEMENLNRTLTGLATVYELQLKSISKQVSTIEQIDEQTRRMAQQIEELNNVYSRMIKALTVNMGGSASHTV